MLTRYPLCRRAPVTALLAVILVCGMGCAVEPARIPELSVLGSFADVVHGGGRLENVELVALQNDTLFVLGGSFAAIPQDSIKTISLRTEESRTWIVYVVLGHLLPATALSFSSEIDIQRIAVVMGGVGIITWASWELSTPQSVFRFPPGESDMKELALHLRFPYGVERSRLEQIDSLAQRSVR